MRDEVADEGEQGLHAGAGDPGVAADDGHLLGFAKVTRDLTERKRHEETLELLNYPKYRWRVVLNRADSKVGLDIREVEKSLRATISAQLPSSRDVPAAINRGVPIVLDDARHPVSVAIKAFAENYVANVPSGPGGNGRQAPATPVRRGLLRRRSKA